MLIIEINIALDIAITFVLLLCVIFIKSNQEIKEYHQSRNCNYSLNNA